ncbi:MAG: hypothetical protein JWQ33_1714, partial [Ramlibacter sp.]|nr:hypothetical protein [Ramlibacter sp.]
MSFLEQLKMQASAVRSQQGERQANHDASTLATEQICQTVL